MNSLNAMLQDPWRLLDAVVDGPLHPGGRDATEQLLDRAGVGESTRFLDVGCGAGDALNAARERGANAVGLDRDPTGDRVVRGDMVALPFADDSFDAVLGECVLCLSSSLADTLADIERVLKPGGRLAFSDVTVEGDAPVIPAPFDEVLCLDGPREQDYIRDRVEGAGFEVEEIRTHHQDVLEMRDRIRESVDIERYASLVGSDNELQAGMQELEAAVESGRVGYISVVASVP